MLNFLLGLFSKEYRDLKRLLGAHPDEDLRLGFRTYNELCRWYNKGNEYARSEHFQEAINCYDRAIAIIPFFAGAWFNKGLALDKCQKYGDAIDCYQRAIEIKGSEDAWINMGISLIHLLRFEDALTCFEKAKRLGASDAEHLIDICK
jgi:tetratricopeptide (TPR) repeat protein